MISPFRPSLAAIVLVCLAGSSCTWVDPDAGAGNVALVMPKHVTDCKSLGTTIAEVKDKVGFINRSEEKVAEELLTLAKNAAVKLGGDTLVADGAPVDGTQRFKIYKCS
jgi:hypothetical protein